MFHGSALILSQAHPSKVQTSFGQRGRETTEIVSHLLAPSSVEDSMNMMWGNRNILSKAGGIVGKHVLNDDARKLLEFDVRICEGTSR